MTTLGDTLKSFIAAALCMATSLLALSAQSAVNPAEEVKDIYDNLLQPASHKGNEAIPLVTTDPIKACQLETEAMANVDQAYVRIQALEQRMKAENQDTSRVTPLKTQIGQFVPIFHQNKEAACSGEMARLQNDPVMGTMARKIAAYMKAFNDDQLAANTAWEQKDMPTFCQRLSDGRTQLNDLSNYAGTWRKTHTMAKEDATAMDGFLATVADLKIKNDARLKQCPAT